MRFEHMTPVQQRDHLMAELEEMRAENATLKLRLSVYDYDSLEDDLAKEYGLSQQTMAVLLILYRARGRTLKHTFIHDSLPMCGSTAREETELKIIAVRICQLRHTFGKDSIITVWGVGYALSPEMVAILDAMRSPVEAV